MLKDKLVTDETLFAEWIGRFLTESGSSGWLPGESDADASCTFSALADDEELERSTLSRLAFVAGDEQCLFFANGQCYSASQTLAEQLCAEYRYRTDVLRTAIRSDADLKLLNTLLQRQILLPCDDTEA